MTLSLLSLLVGIASVAFSPERGKPGVADDAGQKLAAFVYDGFGRLIRTQRWDPLGNSEVESYYYDGVRRVQERIDDDPNNPNSTLTTREYVWGPGYVDEIVCQIDEQGDLLYYLQDANYNVVAVTDEDGAVVAQYAYEPYGGVVVADAFTTTAYPDPNAPPINRIGHQGLFFERLYVDADDPNDPNDPYDTLSDPALSPPTDPNLATPLPGLYQVRNRVLIPNLGRFAQRDVNATALPILTALATNGQSLRVLLGAFAIDRHYMAGLNLYSFTNSDPIGLRDPLGTFPLIDLAMAQGKSAELRAQDARKSALAAAFIAAALGAIYTDMQWGVGGGVAASGLDLIIQGVEATMSGVYAYGENLMVAGETALIEVGTFITTQQRAVRRAVSLMGVIAYHFGKAATGGDGDWGTGRDEWKKQIEGWLDDIESVTKHMGKKTAAKARAWIQLTREALDALMKGGNNMPPPAPF